MVVEWVGRAAAALARYQRAHRPRSGQLAPAPDTADEAGKQGQKHQGCQHAQHLGWGAVGG